MSDTKALEFAGIKALPCPFCGGDDLVFMTRIIRVSIFTFVACRNLNCEAGGPTDLRRSGAIKKWNHASAEPEQLKATIEVCKGAKEVIADRDFDIQVLTNAHARHREELASLRAELDETREAIEAFKFEYPDDYDAMDWWKHVAAPLLAKYPAHPETIDEQAADNGKLWHDNIDLTAQADEMREALERIKATAKSWEGRKEAPYWNLGDIATAVLLKHPKDSKSDTFLDVALNEGDGSYKP